MSTAAWNRKQACKVRRRPNLSESMRRRFARPVAHAAGHHQPEAELGQIGCLATAVANCGMTINRHRRRRRTAASTRRTVRCEHFHGSEVLRFAAAAPCLPACLPERSPWAAERAVGPDHHHNQEGDAQEQHGVWQAVGCDQLRRQREA